MLGKGLESLIPKNGGPGQISDGAPSSQPQPPQPQQPQPHPSFVPPAQPAQPTPQPVQPVVHPQPQPQPQKRDELAQESIYHIEIEKITPNPDQPRRHFDEDGLRELASSIREFGFLQPLVV